MQAYIYFTKNSYFSGVIVLLQWALDMCVNQKFFYEQIPCTMEQMVNTLCKVTINWGLSLCLLIQPVLMIILFVFLYLAICNKTITIWILYGCNVLNVLYCKTETEFKKSTKDSPDFLKFTYLIDFILFCVPFEGVLLTQGRHQYR